MRGENEAFSLRKVIQNDICSCHSQVSETSQLKKHSVDIPQNLHFLIAASLTEAFETGWSKPTIFQTRKRSLREKKVTCLN